MKFSNFTPLVLPLTSSRRFAILLLWLALLVAPITSVRAQLVYGIVNGAYGVTGYNIAGGLNVVIPTTNAGVAVRAIGSYAFYLQNITNIVFPNTITNIVDYAFSNCRQLRDVTLPASLQVFGKVPFGGCQNMTNIFVDPANTNFTSLGGVLFNKTATNIVEFPAGRTGPYSPPEGTLSTSWESFGGCRLSSITLPSTLTNLGNYTFDGCLLLTNFTTHSANPAFKAVDGILYNKTLDTLVAFPGGFTNTFVMPGYLNVTRIGLGAFMDAQLTGIVFSSSVRDIGGLAFGGCQGLTSVIIPAGVTNVQPYAFDSCGFLERVYFLGDRPTTIDTFNPATVWILNDAFGGIPRLTFFYMPGKAGWSPAAGVLPWNPRFGDAAFTNKTLQIACTIPSNSVVVLENCTNLALNSWQPLATNSYVNGGPFTFTNTDTQITNKPVSLYRFRTP